jgi:hypothetical protein
MIIYIKLVKVLTWTSEKGIRKREAMMGYQSLQRIIKLNNTQHMLSTKGIEVSEGDHRGIRWITAANAATTQAVETTPAVPEKSTNNADELQKSNGKINTPTTSSNKKCF